MLFGRWNKETGKGWLIKAVVNNSGELDVRE
jgi:hypothetical protein